MANVLYDKGREGILAVQLDLAGFAERRDRGFDVGHGARNVRIENGNASEPAQAA